MVGNWQPTTEDDSQKLKQFFLINPMLFLQKFINITFRELNIKNFYIDNIDNKVKTGNNIICCFL